MRLNELLFKQEKQLNFIMRLNEFYSNKNYYNEIE